MTPEKAKAKAKRVPLPVAGVDLRSLPLGPRDAFVLSRVDGVSTGADILASTGLEASAVDAALERLLAVGAIRWKGETDQPPLVAAPQPSPSPTHPADGSDETVDLEEHRRRLISETYASLETTDHYQLLGVARNADRKTVKGSYYQVVNVFHPDRYYGKHLGSYKHKLEVIFDRLTEAQEVLSNAQARADYDAYLERQRKTRDIERILSDDSGESEIRRVQQEIDLQAYAEATRAAQQPLLGDSVARTPPGGSLVSAPPVEVLIAESPSAATAEDSHPPLSQGRGCVPAEPLHPIAWSVDDHVTDRPPSSASSDALRKRSLARKLLGSLRPQRTTPVAPARSKSGSDELRRLYEEHALKARHSQIEMLKKTAEEQCASNAFAAAMNTLRLASSLAPGDPELKALLAEAQHRASAELADTYLQQAQYEEKAGRWAAAGRSYERCAAAKPSAFVFSQAARCLLEASGDPRTIADLARKAVSLAPDSAEPRLTLGRVYLAAGMRSSALAELERASRLAPGDTNIRDWLVRARSGKS